MSGLPDITHDWRRGWGRAREIFGCCAGTLPEVHTINVGSICWASGVVGYVVCPKHAPDEAQLELVAVCARWGYTP